MEGEGFMNTFQQSIKTINCVSKHIPEYQSSINFHIISSLFPYIPSLKINITEQGVNKCNWDNEGSVFCGKWYNGRDSHGYYSNISNNSIFNVN
jgi:hypothetical protein